MPDTRQVVTENKLRVLRRQVNSLTQFQSKLEKELEALEEKHEGRKRRFESSIATFEVEMKKHAGKTVVVDQDMIDKQVCSLLVSFMGCYFGCRFCLTVVFSTYFTLLNQVDVSRSRHTQRAIQSGGRASVYLRLMTHGSSHL